MFNLNHRLLTITDQLLLSAIGFATSAAIVKLGGIEQLGIYGAFLAVVTLVHTSYSSVVSGQMLLFISGNSSRVSDAFFRLTEVIWLAYSAVAMGITLLLYFALTHRTENIQLEAIISAGLCAITIALFEQHRKLLYVKKHFFTSTVLTCLFVCVHVAVSYFLITRNSSYYSAKDAFISLSVAYLIASVVNPLFLKTIKNAKKIRITKAVWLHKKYLKQGKFAFGGLSLAWLQNQSLSVYILVLFGPGVAGLFSLGRLVTMPMSVVNTGLINGVLPTFRILALDKKLIALKNMTNKYAGVSLALNVTYAIVIFLALKIDWVLGLQEDLYSAKDYIYLWLVLTTGVAWRTWVTQFLIANLRFQTLLKYNALSALVTLVGVLFFTLLGASALVIASAMLVGEVVIYGLVKMEQNRMLHNELTDN